MLLQLAAPLIHAHKNDTFENSFHLPEFEKISALLDKNTPVFVAFTQKEEVVTIGAGIKTKKRVLKNEPLNSFVLSLFFAVVVLISRRQIFKAITLPTRFQFSNAHSARAPPFSFLA